MTDEPEVEIILPEGAFGGAGEDSIADALRELTKRLMESGVEPDSGYGLGGEYGYGVNHETDEFLIHRYCWCEQGDCPWCGGCQAEWDEASHQEDCYQARLSVLRDSRAGYDDPDYAVAKRDLCAELGVDYNFGNEMHCTCGGDEEFQRRFDACLCDWHLGNGQFRFGKAQQAPNFWHKPTGFRVSWYKWIGRSMEVLNEPDNAIALILGLPKP